MNSIKLAPQIYKLAYLLERMIQKSMWIEKNTESSRKNVARKQSTVIFGMMRMGVEL